MKQGKSYTHLIWDFNGTILDDVQLCIHCVNDMLAARGLDVIPSEAAYREIFGFPIDDYYTRLGFDFEKEDYDTVLAPEWVAKYLAGEGNCVVMPGVRETIQAVKALGIPQVVLSASNLEQLRGQLARLGLLDEFEEVIGLDNIHARSKKAQALAWMAAHPEAHPLFVGDTEHDASVAHAVGADCLLYTGGHQSAGRLLSCDGTLITEIPQLLHYLAT